METECRSTLTYRSNLQPLDGTFQGELRFEQSVRDPFALAILKQRGKELTNIQKQEYNSASCHCSYAAKDDYPWGTIRLQDGSEQVVCKCINIACSFFRNCRPDFNKSELLVLEENKNYNGRAASFYRSTVNEPIIKEDGYNSKVATPVIKRDKCVQSSPRQFEQPDKLPTISVPPPPAPEVRVIAATPKIEPENVAEDSGFASFVEAKQDDIIVSPLSMRIMINAGPGTGKTWTLIEKLIFMLEYQETDPEGLLVLCFSRAAVEVIEQRLQAAADANRIGYNWRKVEIRTFDSFATYLIAWAQEKQSDLLPGGYLLEAQDYEARIKTATGILKKKEDVFAQYEHLIVDEVQDLVGCRAELVLQMLAGLPEKCGFTLLGDACQALYDWQSVDDPDIMSSNEFYQHVFKIYPRISYFSFTENHRQEGNLSSLAVPYRDAILKGSASGRASIAKAIYQAIGTSSVIRPNMCAGDLDGIIKKGTIGILTRTNGQALKISEWLTTAGIRHFLQRPVSDVFLGDWISRVLMKYPNETINKDMFTDAFASIYPHTAAEKINEYWFALVSTQYDTQKSRYNVEDLLKGLLINGKNKFLFTPSYVSEPVIISNIHRAKGREFDSVLVVDDVITAAQDESKDNLQEHKVCYVALTRPRKQLAGIELKNQYIYIDKSGNRRCFQAGGFKNRKYLSHIEMGFTGDFEKNTFAADTNTQAYICSLLTENTRLKLKKCSEGFAPHITYKVVLEENENIVLGYTGKPLADGIKRAIQRIFETSRNIDYKYYPSVFSDIYVDKLITCVSTAGRALNGARMFGNMGIWMGFSVTGFAQMEKDRY